MRKFLSLAALLLLTLPALAQKADKGGGLYAFGYGMCLNDSIVFLTSVQQIPGTYIDKSSGFMAQRAAYGAQLRDFLFQKGYLRIPTCVVLYDTEKSKAEKLLAEVRKQIDKRKQRYLELTAEDFIFTTVAHEAPQAKPVETIE